MFVSYYEQDAENGLLPSSDLTDLAVQDEGPGFDIKAPPFVPGKRHATRGGGLGLAVVTQRTDLVYADGPAIIAVLEADQLKIYL